MKYQQLLPKIFLVLSLVALSGILIFWKAAASFLDLSIHQIMGISIGIIIPIFFYLDNKLSKLLDNSSFELKNDSLIELFRLVSLKSKRIKHLRILAISTSHIFPLFKSSNLYVDKCTILVQGRKKENSSDEEVRFHAHIADLMESWKGLRKSGRITELEVKYYKDTSLEWQIIFDDNHMISGINIPDLDKPGFIEPLDPVLLSPENIESRRLVNKYIERFDKMAQYWSK